MAASTSLSVRVDDFSLKNQAYRETFAIPAEAFSAEYVKNDRLLE